MPCCHSPGNRPCVPCGVDATPLQVGVGTSRIQEDMVRVGGFAHIVNVDYSTVAVRQMSSLHASVPQLEYRVQDVRCVACAWAATHACTLRAPAHLAVAALGGCMHDEKDAQVWGSSAIGLRSMGRAACPASAHAVRAGCVAWPQGHAGGSVLQLRRRV